MTDLKNRVALVTGASRGIGAGIAIALARAGASVAVNYLERADAAKAVCNEIRAMGRNAIPIQADVSVSTDVKRMVKEIDHFLGGIDILVNNAAIAKPRRNQDSSMTIPPTASKPRNCLDICGDRDKVKASTHSPTITK